VIYHGNALATLPELPDNSVHCVVTSPPYYGLRDYGVDGQIGLERTYVEYIDKMVAVFREVRRVLREDGTLWLNIGDSYATGAGAVGECPGGGEQGERWKGNRGASPTNSKHGVGIGPMTQMNRLPQPSLKPKDLMMIPARLAIALQEDGWYLRSDIIWHKPNPMPESVTDRPTTAHEHIFLFAKSEKYSYDFEAIKEPSTGTAHDRARKDRPDVWQPVGREGKNSRFHQDRDPLHPSERKTRKISESGSGVRYNESYNASITATVDTRNKRSVWTVATQPYKEAHFATFPEALIEPCIKAGCPAGGTVLDPFGGSGTTAVVARRMGCHAILLELNEAYCALSAKRLNQGVLDLTA